MGVGDQRIMKIPLHRLPTRFSFSLFVIAATNTFGHAEQAAIIPVLSQGHCEGFGTWVPVSPLSKALFLFLSLSCSTRLHFKEQKSSFSSLVGKQLRKALLKINHPRIFQNHLLCQRLLHKDAGNFLV